MAAGVRDDAGRLIAGLSISAPADRLSDDWLDDLIATTTDISSVLGFRST
jgi:DNA-binding IclR family transcriptional regulator